MLVLATTLFGPRFSFGRHFEQRSAAYSLLKDRQVLTISTKCSHVFTEQCLAINRLSIRHWVIAVVNRNRFWLIAID